MRITAIVDFLPRIARVWAFVALGGLVATAATVRAAESPIFRAGFAERDVSPQVGDEAPGGYGKARHKAFHDPCKVRAAVFDDGVGPVAIVGVDALLVRKPTVAEARRRIAERTGIPGERVMIAASHSHSAGPTGMILPGEYDADAPLLRQLAYEKTVVASPEYLEKLVAGIAAAVAEAHERRADARAAAGYGLAEGVAFNRRFRMRDGFTMTHPGVGNPDIVAAAGGVDPQVGVLGAWNAKGECLGAVVNFACHATTGPPGISADYVFHLERTLRGALGDGCIVVFTAGMAGDVTQVDNRSRFATPQFGDAAARRLGSTVGAAAATKLLELEPAAGPLLPLAAAGRTLEIPRRAPRPERVAKARAIVEAPADAKIDPTEWTFAKEIVLLDARIAREPVAPVELQAIQVGPAVFLSCPAEYFVDYGLELKAAGPFPVTFPVSLANDCVGYVPTEEALGPRGGGYETRLTSYSNLVPSAGRTICDSLKGLAAGLAPGPLPAAPPAAPFKGQPWSYGSLRPELD
jgi:neutral ceramidase